MDVREKLVELLSYFADFYPVEIRNIEEGQRVCEIADHLIANGVTILDCKIDCANCWKTKLVTPMWISVKDRLPGFGIERVLVMTNGDHIMGYPKMDTDRYLNGGWVRYGDNVTHWMPLPEPPSADMKGRAHTSSAPTAAQRWIWSVDNDKRRNTEHRQDVRVRRQRAGLRKS